MNMGKLKDLEFKQLMVEKMGRSCKLGFGSDFERQNKENQITLFEYENSSRGMSMNFLRVFRLMKQKNITSLHLVFIRTEHHLKNHGNDLKNTESIFETVQKIYPEFRMSVFNSFDFFKEIEGVKKEMENQYVFKESEE